MSKKPAILLAVIVCVVVVVSLGLVAQRQGDKRSVSGTIETDEVHVASRYGGRVTKIHAEEGQSLKPGDVIVDLEASELQSRRDQAVAHLSELERGPRGAEIAAASNDWQAVAVQLEFARAEEQRAKELFVKQSISTTERDLAATRARSLEANMSAAKKRLELLQEGTRPEQIDQARARLAEIEAQIREMRIVSPTNCLLEVLSVKVGDVLPANREVATLLLPQHLWVRVYVPEPWLGHIQLGQKVEVVVDSFADKKFVGTVEQINRRAEFTPRNVQTAAERVKQVFGVKVRLPSDDGSLRPGISADVTFPNVPAPTR